MIQRIQTLYLLIVTVLQTILFFSNMATVLMPNNEVTVYKCTNFWAIAVLIAITILLSFFSIFLYRKRIAQIRINIYNLILLLCLQGYLIYYLIDITRKFESVTYSIPTIFPIISAILTFLAIRNIGKDEALIKALNRIR